MAKRKRVPDRIGHAEGGSSLPALHELMNAVAEDMKDLYTESSLDDSQRRIRMTSEDTVVHLEVNETSPANEATAVAVDSDITVTYDRHVKLADDAAAAIAAVSVTFDDDGTETEAAISTITIADAVVTIAMDGNLTAGTEHTVRVPVVSTFVADDEFEDTMESELVFSFTTA